MIYLQNYLNNRTRYRQKGGLDRNREALRRGCASSDVLVELEKMADGKTIIRSGFEIRYSSRTRMPFCDLGISSNEEFCPEIEVHQ